MMYRAYTVMVGPGHLYDKGVQNRLTRGNFGKGRKGQETNGKERKEEGRGGMGK